mgnify:CR=1 FL=1
MYYGNLENTRLKSRSQRDQNYMEQQNILGMVSHNLNQSINYSDRIPLSMNQTSPLDNSQTEQAIYSLSQMRNNPLEQSVYEKRSNEYRNTIDKINTTNPYKLFGIDKDFTLKQLKKKYIRLTRACHPDVPGGDENQFSIITKYYLYLLEQYNERKLKEKYSTQNTIINKNHIDKITKNRNIENKKVNDKSRLNLGSGDNFDNTKFNKIFEQNVFHDPNHEGYGNWLLKANENNKEMPKMFGKKFNNNIFNTAFEEELKQQKTAIIPLSQIKSFNEDTGGFAGSTSLIDNGGNFSSMGSGLQAVDLKQVYSSGLLGVSQNHSRQSYQSVKDYEYQRNMSMGPMNDIERRQQYEQEKYYKQQEQQRLNQIAERDRLITEHHNKIRGLIR